MIAGRSADSIAPPLFLLQSGVAEMRGLMKANAG